MEQNQHPNTCMCGSCSTGYMKFHLLRWILGLFIIFMVFSFGVRIGEFKNQLETNEHAMMYSGYPGKMMRYTYEPSMAGEVGQVQMMTTQPVSVTPVSAKVVK